MILWLVLLPFLIITLLALPVMDWSVVYSGLPASEITLSQFTALLSVLFWNTNGWDAASNLSGEIKNPQRTLPLAILISLILCNSAYILPLAASTGTLPVQGSFDSWRAGFFQAVGVHLGGQWLGGLVLFSAALACIGQFQADMSSSAYLLQSMGEIGMLPTIVGLRSRYDSPVVGIAINTLFVLLTATSRFVDILDMVNSVFCLAVLVEFAILLHLRWRHPTMNRPFRIPAGLATLCIVYSIPSAFALFFLFVPVAQSNWAMIGFTLSVLFGSHIVYLLVETGRRRNWFNFCEDPPRDANDVFKRLETF